MGRSLLSSAGVCVFPLATALRCPPGSPDLAIPALARRLQACPTGGSGGYLGEGRLSPRLSSAYRIT